MIVSAEPSSCPRPGSAFGSLTIWQSESGDDTLSKKRSGTPVQEFVECFPGCEATFRNVINDWCHGAKYELASNSGNAAGYRIVAFLSRATAPADDRIHLIRRGDFVSTDSSTPKVERSGVEYNLSWQSVQQGDVIVFRSGFPSEIGARDVIVRPGKHCFD